MKETIIFKDVLGLHKVTGEILEDKGKYVSIDDGHNELYIHKRQIRQRMKTGQEQSQLSAYV